MATHHQNAAPFQLLLLVAAVAIPAFGVVHAVVGPPEQPFQIAGRVTLAVISVVALIASRLDRRPARWLRPVGLGVGYLVTAWFVISPGMTTLQGMNLVLVSSLILVGLRQVWEVVVYGAFTIAATLVAWKLDPDPEVSLALQVGLELCVIPTLGTLQLRRVRLEEELEERVRQRTGDLVESLRRLEHEVEVRRIAEAAALEADAAKSTFLATMSHELRTPLTAILGYTELLQEELPEDAAPDLEHVRGSARQLLQLVDDVLDLARVDAGRIELSPGDWTLRDLIEPAVTEIRSVARQKGLELRCSMPGELVLHTDRIRVRQILANLLSNAVKFTERGSVSVEAVQEGDCVRIAVTDTGPGLSPEVQARLFQRFVQADPSTTRKHGGTGLGLAICRELAQILGGGVEVRSVVGEGSTFTLTLPLR
ncbi:MAG: HAMP domain-containing histidine kinase [Alphaproteobacteria bacterium]|nr:HAMP domain-containing histidine kinase [Alphaproteobacteria bacterium]MCB9697492.1 HAMP domain-containing histidine kinase [Alphaproteobacteria bacterium]